MHRLAGRAAAASVRADGYRSRVAAALPLALALAATPVLADEAPRRVLVLNSFGRDFAPYRTVASAFRTELARLSPAPIDFLEVSLETSRFDAPDDAPVVGYVRALCARRRFDLVVPNGAPAARFWLEHRAKLLPDVPTLVASIDEQNLKGLALGDDTAAVAVRIDLEAQLRNILDVLPGTKTVLIVAGSSPLEKAWLERIRAAWKPFEGKVKITEAANQPFEETVRQSASLPPRTVIFFALMLVDAAGVPYEAETAIDRLRQASRAPIFTWADDFFGRGIVGGPMVPLGDAGREAARAALAILSGRPVAEVRPEVVQAGPPVYDWRELSRFGVDSSRLAGGSEVRFKPASLLGQYRWLIAASLLLIALQAFAITALLLTRHRRRQAEDESRRLRSELAHAGRVSAVGQLASSLAHELNQPLGAILRNAEAAELFLAADPPDLAEVKAILADIRQDDLRAGSVIDEVRTLLRRHGTEFKPVDLGEVAQAVAALTRPDAQTRGVDMSVEAERGLPLVSGNSVQLQQVLLNLILNGMEAMERTPEGNRTLRVRVRPADRAHVEMSVTDAGPGIPDRELARIFDNFYTTKTSGIGMGLAICKRIVEAHSGRIEAGNERGGGATLRVVLPSQGAPA